MNDFLKFLNVKKLSINTIKTYESSLKIMNVENWNWKRIIEVIFNKSYSSNTIHLHKNVLLQYLKFKKNRKYIRKLQIIKMPAIDIKYYSTISKNLIYKKTQIQDTDTLNDSKWKTIIRFIFETGIRAHELNHLKFEKKKLFTLGKGNKLRQIFYIESTLYKLLEYFPNLKGFSHTKTLRIAVKNYLGKKYTPHSIRRSFATHMLNNGSNIKSLMLQMGHSKIETTFRYLNLSELYNKNNYLKIMKK